MALDPVGLQEFDDLAERFVHHPEDRYAEDNQGRLFRLQVISDEPSIQVRYFNGRKRGLSHDEAFSFAAKTVARRERRGPYEDGDTIAFVRLNPDNLPRVSKDFGQQVRYWHMRMDGSRTTWPTCSPTTLFPGVRTDATFNRGRCNGNQFETHPELGDQYRRLADAAGVNTTGKHYCSGLADFPGDPTAWISDRGDVLRVAREKGYRVSGAVEYDPGEREPMPDVAIAPDIVDAVDHYMENQPGERREDVVERLTELLTGQVDDEPPARPGPSPRHRVRRVRWATPTCA
jgi:hypothetical protein